MDNGSVRLAAPYAAPNGMPYAAPRLTPDSATGLRGNSVGFVSLGDAPYRRNWLWVAVHFFCLFACLLNVLGFLYCTYYAYSDEMQDYPCSLSSFVAWVFRKLFFLDYVYAIMAAAMSLMFITYPLTSVRARRLTAVYSAMNVIWATLVLNHCVRWQRNSPLEVYNKVLTCFRVAAIFIYGLPLLSSAAPGIFKPRLWQPCYVDSE